MSSVVLLLETSCDNFDLRSVFLNFPCQFKDKRSPFICENLALDSCNEISSDEVSVLLGKETATLVSGF